MPTPLFIRRLAAEVPSLEEIPLFGHAPAFDWSYFSSLLADRLNVEALQLKPKQQRWLSPEEIRKGLGSSYLAIPLTMTPLASPIYWIMGNAAIGKLTSWMLNGNAQGPAFSSEILQEGFYRYLLLQSLDAIGACPPLQRLTPELGEEASLPEEGGFCIDIEFSFDGHTCWGRLVLSEAFRKEWVQHFASLPSEYAPSAFSRQLPLIFGVKTGSFTLSQQEWKRLKLGDFVLLDYGGYDARKSQGAAFLTLGSTPLFQVKIKHNKLELLDLAVSYEEPMEKESLQTEAPEAEEVSPLRELPLKVTVEIARIKMTLDQLMNLAPGNTLELPIQPDQSVSLTVNGQKIGRAELVHIGEALGIRILEIG